MNEPADIKTMTPPEGKALVYVVRPSWFGFAINFKVYFNDTYIGKTKGKRFLYTVLDPGTYHVISKAENKSEVSLNAEPGKIYYLKQSVGFGFIKARNSLYQIHEEIGKKALRKCRLGILPK